MDIPVELIINSYNGSFPKVNSILFNHKLSDYCIVQSESNQLALEIFEPMIKIPDNHCCLSNTSRRTLNTPFSSKIIFTYKKKDF